MGNDGSKDKNNDKGFEVLINIKMMKKQEERDAKKAKAEMDKNKKQLAEAIKKGDSVQIDHCSKKTLLEKKN